MSNAKQSDGASRRQFLGRSGAAAGIALAAPFASLFAEQKAFGRFPLRPGASPYGPLTPVKDGTTGLELLRLPRGFRYFSMGWTGDVMSDGTLTPDRHDGMAVVTTKTRYGWETTLIRNHERGASAPGNPLPVIGDGKAPTYDVFAIPGAITGLGGGTTSLTVKNGQLVHDQATLAGTLTNCAGGPTPWGSWLTCEEVTIRGALIGARDHGYVYEVPDPALGAASAQPIVDMGFMDHEAAAVDPRDGIVYLTEDNGPACGFYRFLPHDRGGRIGSLERGGVLQMLKVVERPQADLREPEQGDEFEVEWVTIDDPNADPENLVPPDVGFPPIEGSGKSGPFLQGEAAGGATFRRGEGCWYHDNVIYMVDTSGGAAGKGVLWALVRGRGSQNDRLVAIFVSPREAVADNPDNVTISPRSGGVLMCEDGGGIRDTSGNLVTGTRLIGLNQWGTAYAFAENNMVISSPIPGKPLIAPDDYRGREFAGACFDPQGNWLYVNIQTPGVTFAIQGPFRRGPL